MPPPHLRQIIKSPMPFDIYDSDDEDEYNRLASQSFDGEETVKQ